MPRINTAIGNSEIVQQTIASTIYHCALKNGCADCKTPDILKTCDLPAQVMSLQIFINVLGTSLADEMHDAFCKNCKHRKRGVCVRSGLRLRDYSDLIGRADKCPIVGGSKCKR